MKAVLDDDSTGDKETDALAEECNRAIREHDTPALMRYFEDVLDNLHSSPSSSVFSEPEASTHEREKLERDDAQFRAALTIQVNEALRGHGIRVTRVLENGERDGYVVCARDRAGRGYETTLKYGKAEELSAIYGDEGMVRRMFDEVARAILNERARYFARMQ